MNDLHQVASAATRRISLIGLFTALVTFNVFASSSEIRSLFNDGRFAEVAEKASSEIEKARKSGKFSDAAFMGLYTARSLIQLEKYDEAQELLTSAVADAEKESSDKALLASLYFAEAHLFRVKKDFLFASSRSRDAFALAPKNPQVELEYYVTNARILFSSGYDISAIVWLEKAESLSKTLPMSELKLEVFRFLSLAWQSKFYYSKAISYAQNLVEASRNTEFRFRHRLALYEYGNLLSAGGQEQRARTIYESGLILAKAAKDDKQSGNVLSTLLLNALYQNDLQTAQKHLRDLTDLDKVKHFEQEVTLGNAVVAELQDRTEEADQYFAGLETLRSTSKFFVPYWKAILAQRKHDWAKLIELVEELRKLSEEENFREDLPHFYLMLARGHWGLGNKELALKNVNMAEALINEARPADDAPLSLSMLETFHSVYRLMAEIEANPNGIVRSFEIADYLKARVLSDRINFSPVKQIPDISELTRKRANDLSTRFLSSGDKGELDIFESNITTAIPENTANFSKSLDLRNVHGLDETAVVSYFFSLNGELVAYILEKGSRLRIVSLSLSEQDVARVAENTRKKILSHIFFKNDGKDIYDQLVAPLSLTSSHIIFVPDKSLWKIPFHALSPDGESYLIEKKMISYAPSVSVLLESLKGQAPVRKSARVFANDTFENRSLKFVNLEAASVAKLLGVRPIIGATSEQFTSQSGAADILHFSLHAQADREEPLESFLGFRPSAKNNGRVTINDLMKVRLKRQSLAFVASCDTSNVLNGEGVVSIGWAILGSGSSTVISSQWEANDKSTEQFAKHFYTEYRKGMSVSRAMQLASISMIKNKSSETHEPYYWATFTLLGDYR